MFRFHSPRLWKMRPCRRKSLYSRPRKHSAAAGCDRRLEYTHLIASGELNSLPWQRRGDGEAVKKLESSAIPLLASLRHHCKEGWPSDSENIAKHPLIARPGWFSDESKRKTAPAASASVASPNFL